MALLLPQALPGFGHPPPMALGPPGLCGPAGGAEGGDFPHRYSAEQREATQAG